MTTPNPSVFRFCDVEVREAERRVTRAGEPLPLEPKAYRVLIYLLHHPGHLVTKNELLDAVWGETAVTESSLTRAIALLRHALEDDPHQPRFIETVSTAGYRLICAVQVEDESASTAVPTASNIEPGKSPPALSKSRVLRSRFWIPVGIGAIALAALLIVAVAYLRRPFGRSTTTELPLMAVPLTAYPGLALQPTFSPDGNEVAFSWNEEKQDHYEIYRKLIGPGEPLRLNTGSRGGYSPAWSPDGRFIAYYRPTPSGHKQVCVIPALGGPERQLPEIHPEWWFINFPHITLAWTHDGKWVIVPDMVPGHGEPAGLFLISAESGEKRRLTSTKRWDEYPSLSPDGRTLAFVRAFELGNQDVYLLSLTEGLQAQGEPERLTYENRLVESPVWTRDGKEILFSSGGWWGERNIRRIAVGERGSPSSYRPRATSFGEDATTLSISSTSNRLVYTRLSQIVNIYRVELSSAGNAIGTPQRVTATSRVNYQANFSPDGKRITFTSTRSGNQEIWVSDVDGRNPRQMTSMGGPLTSDSIWSPDGKTIAFNSRWKGLSDIYVVGVDGGAPRALTNGPYDNYWPTWSHDGKWIYFMSNRNGELRVYKIPAGGGDPIQLTQHESWQFPFESEDGKWMYLFGWAGQSGLWKVSIGGGKEIRVMESVPDFLNYVIANGGVYFLDGRYDKNAPASIDFFDFASGKTKLVIKTGKPISIGIAISPDQRWLLFTEVEYLGSDLMLVDNFR